MLVVRLGPIITVGALMRRVNFTGLENKW